jgi:hypothetical protein
MVSWTDVVLAYATYLAGVAWSSRRFARARFPAVGALAVSLALWWAWPMVPASNDITSVAARIVIPSLALLAAYRVSGWLFVEPMPLLERALLDLDRRALVCSGVLSWYQSAPGIIRGFFELMYVLVYAVVPAGATVLALANRSDALDGYWVTVLVSELACFAMLPWLQTRPPRAIESRSAATLQESPLRRLNLAILSRGSIQVNTVPSGHAAGSFALGRYHYLADSVLGVLVAVGVWAARGFGLSSS